VDDRAGKPTRVGTRYLDDGSKERFSKKSGASLGQVAPPHKSHAKK
jgi:large subunit ribosomal protein L24